MEAGNYKEAIDAFERGLTLHQTARLINPSTDEVLGLGRAYLGQKDFPRAMENLTKVLQIAEGRRQYATIQAASAALGDVFLQTEKPSEAIAYYKKAIDSIESTRSLLESEELRASFFEDKGQSYGGIIEAQLRTKNFEEAFNYNERARSRAFLDILGSKVQLGRQGALIEEERTLQAKVSELRAKLAGQRGTDGAEVDSGLEQLRQELETAQRAYADFLVKARKENKEQASLMSVEPLTLKQVQERLDPGVTMLEYFVARGTVWLWVVEKDRVEFVSTSIAKSDLVSKVTALRDTIYQLSEKDRFTVLAQELYKLLIEPSLPHIKGKEVVIVPHDVLHYLPFQTLQGTDGRYLIEKYPIYYLSSASLLQFTAEKRRAKGDNVLAFGNPDLGDPEKNLEFAELEAQEIKTAFPQSAVYLKKDATEEQSKALSGDRDILHFATHAELKQDDPLSSAILLAKEDKEDGRLEVREIFGMNLKANLVVLSGCETGLGKLSTGDELVGLTRAFIYAGTPSVMASLWKVDDASTAHLMSNFYRNLKTMTKVEALRQAQLALIRGSGQSELLARRRCRPRSFWRKKTEKTAGSK
jgi:CHAT domain-containing protein